ncbi:MAG: response regulator transcription factor [Gemmatimonas sp.]|jgi:two-component system response regulator DevR
MTERPHLLRIFVDVRDPWARRVVRDALSRETTVRFVASASAADVVVGERLEQAALPTDLAPSTSTASQSLTDRERDVLQALSEGMSNGAIAEQLGISRSTVKFHLTALFEKLGVRRRAEAVAAGVRRGDVLL